MQLSITSEIGRLKTVLMHRPGREIDGMPPAMADELLFDDILFGTRAREEHRRLCRVISLVADEVLLLGDLLRESLEDEHARQSVVTYICNKLALDDAVRRRLGEASAEELSAQLIEGMLRPGVDANTPHESGNYYILPPLPNLLFHRDPAVVIGSKVMVSSMATHARLREPLLLETIFRYHPEMRDVVDIAYCPFELDFRRSRSTAHPRPAIEGGDVLVVREDLLLVGSSIRTHRRTIEDLAAALVAHGSPVRTVLVVELPRARSCMHLDTVFTLINHNECLVYEPIVLEGRSEEAAVYELDLASDGIAYRRKRSLLSALAEHGIELEPVLCGGDDPIAQQREQWTDGANAFALAPGVILLYRRNEHTAAQLERAGYEIVLEDDLLLGRAEVNLRKAGEKKYAILFTGHELSRARGGPRCLTMPLRRDAP